MPSVQLPGIQVYYEEEGQGAPVVFLHGFTVDRRMWEPQREFFASWYRVILPDSRGHGLSEAPPTGYARDDRVNDLRELADILELERFHLVGLSMGGSTAVGFALKYQERLRSLTLVSTGAAGYDFGKKISRIDELARSSGIETARAQWMEWGLRWFTPEQRPIVELLEKMMREHSGAIWADPMRGKYPRTVDLEHVNRIRVPTHIFVGEKDKMFIPLSERLHERIPGSRLIQFAGAGHMINLEQPDEFNRHLKEMLEASSIT